MHRTGHLFLLVFFIFFGGRATHPPRTLLPTMPRRCTPATPSAPGRTAHDRQRTDTHARTLDTLHRSAPDTRQAARGRPGWRRGLESAQPLYHMYYDSSITGMVY
nr:MAG TPA: hypothetical protein [Caudoviricetes sp.]